MRSSESSSKSLSLNSQTCRVGNGEHPELDPREAAFVTKPCDSIPINTISCAVLNKKEFIEDDLGGLSLDVKLQTQTSLSSLPFLIPILDPRSFSIDGEKIDSPIVGVNLRNIFTSNPNKYAGGIHLSKLKIKEGLLGNSAFRSKKTILFSSGRDTLIENLWLEAESLSFYIKIKEAGFSLATGFNFSIFWGECPIGQEANTKKSLITSREYENAGVDSIPHFYWHNDFQLRRRLDFLARNPKINFITINCQCYREEDFPILAKGIRFFIRNLDREIHFLLEGGPLVKILPYLQDVAPAIHVASKNPGLDAWNGKRLEVRNGSLKRINDFQTPKGSLVVENFKVYELYLKEMALTQGIIFNPASLKEANYSKSKK